MLVMVIDGQGGGMGRQLVSQLKKEMPAVETLAVGTNTMATQAMLKAGADQAATGENAVIAGCRRADVIVGPIGIVIADALLGEISPAMALAVAQSRGKRILLPTNLCDNYVAGVGEATLSRLIEDSIAKIKSWA